VKQVLTEQDRLLRRRRLGRQLLWSVPALQGQQLLNLQKQPAKQELTKQEKLLRRRRLERQLLWSVLAMQGQLLQSMMPNQTRRQPVKQELIKQDRLLRKRRLGKQLLWSVPVLQGQQLPNLQNQTLKQPVNQGLTEREKLLRRRRLGRQLLWSVPVLQEGTRGGAALHQTLASIVHGKHLKRKRQESRQPLNVQELPAWRAKVTKKMEEKTKKRKPGKLLPLNEPELHQELTGPGRLSRRRKSARQLLLKEHEEQEVMPQQVSTDLKPALTEQSKLLSRRKLEKQQLWSVQEQGHEQQVKTPLRNWDLARMPAGAVEEDLEVLVVGNWVVVVWVHVAWVVPVVLAGACLVAGLVVPKPSLLACWCAFTD